MMYKEDDVIFAETPQGNFRYEILDTQGTFIKLFNRDKGGVSTVNREWFTDNKITLLFRKGENSDESKNN